MTAKDWAITAAVVAHTVLALAGAALVVLEVVRMA
jgi:hypothetical protein